MDIVGHKAISVMGLGKNPDPHCDFCIKKSCCCQKCARLSLDFQELKSVKKWILQNCCQFFIDEKLKKLFHFFISILPIPNYVPYEIITEFWKNSHFENMTADFVLSCQNRRNLFTHLSGNAFPRQALWSVLQSAINVSKYSFGMKKP